MAARGRAGGTSDLHATIVELETVAAPNAGRATARPGGTTDKASGDRPGETVPTGAGSAPATVVRPIGRAGRSGATTTARTATSGVTGLAEAAGRAAAATARARVSVATTDLLAATTPIGGPRHETAHAATTSSASSSRLCLTT
jgi:hypothetical protein